MARVRSYDRHNTSNLALHNIFNSGQVFSVSPFTQYFVRKLLRRYVSQARSLTTYFKVADPAQADCAKVLRSICRSEHQYQNLLYELESLIAAHSQLESSQAKYSPATANAELLKIETQIQHLLALRLASRLPPQLPRLLLESSGQSFQFCLGQRLQTGICYHDHFYGLLQRWPIESRLQAYCLAWTLSQKAVTCIITRSAQDYAVWISLKSSVAQVLLLRGQTIDSPLLFKLNSVSYRRPARVALGNAIAFTDAAPVQTRKSPSAKKVTTITG